MEAARPGGRRRRARRGTVDRPLNARLVRVAAVVVAPALLALLFSISTTGTLPRPPLDPLFDTASAAALATELRSTTRRACPARSAPRTRRSGTGRRSPASVSRRSEDVWTADLPDLGEVELRNVVTVVPGRSRGGDRLSSPIATTQGSARRSATTRPARPRSSSSRAATRRRRRSCAAARNGRSCSSRRTRGAYGGAGARAFRRRRRRTRRRRSPRSCSTASAGGAAPASRSPATRASSAPRTLVSTATARDRGADRSAAGAPSVPGSSSISASRSQPASRARSSSTGSRRSPSRPPTRATRRSRRATAGAARGRRGSAGSGGRPRRSSASLDASVGAAFRTHATAVPRRPCCERLGGAAHTHRRRRPVRPRRPRPARPRAAPAASRCCPAFRGIARPLPRRALRRARRLDRVARGRLPDGRVAPAPALVRRGRLADRRVSRSLARRVRRGWLVARRRLVARRATRRPRSGWPATRPRSRGSPRSRSSSRSCSRSRSSSSCRRSTPGSGCRCGPVLAAHRASTSRGLLGPLGGLLVLGRRARPRPGRHLLYVVGLATVGYVPLPPSCSLRVGGRGRPARRSRVRPVRAICRRRGATAARSAPARRRRGSRGAGVRQRRSGRPRPQRSRPRRAERARARPRWMRGRSCATPDPRSPRAGRRRRRSRCAPQELVALRVPAKRDGGRPTSNAGPGSAAPWRARSAGRTKRSAPTSAETGLPGSPKTSVEPRTPKESGLPGLTATPQKTSSTPSSAAIRRTRSCGPTETPPEVTRTSAVEPRARARSVCGLVVAARRGAARPRRRPRRARPRSSGGSTRRSGPARAARRARAARSRWPGWRPEGVVRR